MDEGEGQGKSLGAYENMERSDIRPDFYEEDKEDKKEKRASAAKGALQAGENFASKKAGSGAAAAVGGAVGGAAGAAIKAVSAARGAEKSGGGLLGGGNGKGKGDSRITVKKAAPVIALFMGVILLYGAISMFGQWLFPFGFKAREVEDWNSTKVSTTARTDELTDNTQLAGDESSEVINDIVFEDMGFTEEQVKSFNGSGLSYVKEGGTVALTYEDSDGATHVITSSEKVSATSGGAIADSDGTVTDSGSVSDEVAIEQKKQQVLDDLGIAAETGHVMGFKEAMEKDWDFKEKFIRGARAWRGDVSGWYSQMTETVMQRLGISRNNYATFKLTGDNEEDERAFIEIAKTLPAAEEKNDVGDKSLEERVQEVAKDAGNYDCGAISAANDIEGVITADQTARQVSAGSLWLEAIDKSMAGEGSEAPLSVANNIIVRNGGADTEGIHHLFGSGNLNQSNENLLSSSAQANIGENGTVDFGDLENPKIYRECVYEGNTNSDNGEVRGNGVIVAIGSMFRKALAWAEGLVNKLKTLFSGATGVTVSALDGTIAKYNQMKEQTFFGDDNTAVLGEAMVNSAERIMGEKAKTAGQTTGDNASVVAFYRAQQEVIAEQAEYDRRTKSPFDVTSQHTFLGSLAYSLIPLATSTQSLSVTGMMGGIGSLFSSALTNLLPTSSAVSETRFTFNRGDCVLANSLLAVSDGYCNQYYTSDLNLSGMKPVEIFDTVAELRYDKKGYVYGCGNGINCEDKEKEERGDPDFGDGPLNEAENGAGHHWPESMDGKIRSDHSVGGPHGCETDWYWKYEIKSGMGPKPVKVYYFEYPTEWSYSRYTNFEYEGYQTGWHNRNDSENPTEPGIEEAKNDEAPGECELDFKVRETDRQPVINQNGALMAFMVMSGQRGSDWGSTDDSNLEWLTKRDFTKGRFHPNAVGATNENVLHPDKDSAEDESESIYEELGWQDEQATAESEYMSRWVGGTAYTMRTAQSAAAGTGDDGIYNVYNGEEKVFKDATMNDDYFWNEMKYYQAYVELLEWMEAIGKLTSTTTGDAIAKYYRENPLDNSYEGIIARYSGMSKDHVVAVLDLINYTEFLANYNPSDMGPLKPQEAEGIYYEDTEAVAQAEPAVRQENIIYDETRNRNTALA